jgi:hypothetical protein
MLLFFASSFSGAAERRYRKNEARHKLLISLHFNGKEGAELSAIAEESAPMIGTTMRGAGSAAGRTDPTRWEQAHGSRHQQACARSARRWETASTCWPVPGVSVPLARYELLEALPQPAETGRDARRDGRRGSAQAVSAPARVRGLRLDSPARIAPQCHEEGHDATFDASISAPRPCRRPSAHPNILHVCVVPL